MLASLRTGPRLALAERIAAPGERVAILAHGEAIAAAAAALRAAEADPAKLAEARARLRALIVAIGDQSNLILDNVLETYYLTDATLNRLPDVMDRLAETALLAAVTSARRLPAGASSDQWESIDRTKRLAKARGENMSGEP